MKLPRDLSGRDLARSLQRYNYEIIRQQGSHLQLTSHHKGFEHHVTIPDHRQLRVGTLHKILKRVAIYLEVDVEDLTKGLFGG